MQHDDILGWRKIPNNNQTYEAEEFRTTLRTNSRGMRGPDFSFPNEDGAYRILILGDSFAEGYSVEFDQLFSEIVRDRVNSKLDSAVEVINLGTAGYSTDQELLLFQNEGQLYAPELTVLMFYDNDIWFNGRDKFYRGYKPVFRMVDNGLKLTNVPVPRAEEHYYEKYFGNGVPAKKVPDKTDDSILRRIKRGVGNNSKFYRFVADRVERSYELNSWMVKAGIVDEKLKPKSRKRMQDEFRIWHRTQDDEVDDAWMITRKLIEKLKQDVDAAGSELLVFYITNKANIYPDVWEATKRQYGLIDAEWDIERPGKILASMCENLGIEFIDSSAGFRQEARKLSEDGLQLYFDSDPHWNVHGHKLAGEILSARISRISLVRRTTH